MFSFGRQSLWIGAVLKFHMLSNHVPSSTYFDAAAEQTVVKSVIYELLSPLSAPGVGFKAKLSCPVLECYLLKFFLLA